MDAAIDGFCEGERGMPMQVSVHSAHQGAQRTSTNLADHEHAHGDTSIEVQRPWRAEMAANVYDTIHFACLNI
jgi:hypothetical protein